MHIGILTFHSQLNYGGVLQCYALQIAIEQLGHTVQVIDRWINPTCMTRPSLWGNRHGIAKLRFSLHMIPGLRCYEIEQRIQKTNHFIKENLNLTEFHFHRWDEVEVSDLADFDAIVVGSDQVWNCDYQNPEVYLLKNAPYTGQRIAYAVSMGVERIPETMRALYVDHCAKFDYISMREKAGVELMQGLGFTADHVCDPTVLLTKKQWSDSFHCGNNSENLLVCYFMTDSFREYLPQLQVFSQKQHCKVTILLSEGASPYPGFKSPKALCKYVRSLYSNHVSYEMAESPLDFVRYFARAKWILSDSFHALMFSIIFDKNVRIIVPSERERQKMFCRISEYNEYVEHGSFLSNNINTALASFVSDTEVAFNTTKIDNFRRYSMKKLHGSFTK